MALPVLAARGAARAPATPVPPGVRFFYWEDRPSDRSALLRASCDANGFTAEPIGGGPIPSRFHSSLFKQGALQAALDGLPDQQIVCATDAFDVFFQLDAHEIGARFLEFGCDVVFSAERGYTHQYRRYKPFFDAATRSPYRYLNAGSVIGRAGALRALYSIGPLLRLKVALGRQKWFARPVAMINRVYRRLFRTSDPRDPKVSFIPWYGYTDQARMARALATGSPDLDIRLDTTCRLFWCTAYEWNDIEQHFDVSGTRLRNRNTGEVPAAIHVPWQRQRDVFERLYRTWNDARASFTASTS
jgi:hypothetical protein